MAKKEHKEKSIEETLWESANKLRGSVEPGYKHGERRPTASARRREQTGIVELI